MSEEQKKIKTNNNRFDFLGLILGEGYIACHNERYDLNRRNISGPLYVPLKKSRVTINNDEVIVYEEEELS